MRTWQTIYKDGLRIEHDGTKWWYLNNKLHRDDGPAVEFNDGEKWWYINGKRHRVDGPAIESSHRTRWILNDKPYTYKDWLKQPEVIESERLKKLEMV